ncbi:MAG: hypothetical protein FJY98_04595 [Candidatus Liptonbacteria bacterium]|nr:hypothetical protein [Candidatus Liptonbacteria bacterium]
MLEFVLANIAMLSVGIVLYLVAHSLPRIGETQTESQGFLERWVASEFPEKLDTAFNSFAGKFLRKLRVIILKFDNAVSESLKKVKSQDASTKPIDLFDKLTAPSDTKPEVDIQPKMGDKEGAPSEVQPKSIGKKKK